MADRASVTDPAADLGDAPAKTSIRNSDSGSELLVPLSFGDRLAGVEHAATLLGWVVPRRSLEQELNADKLVEALRRVGERWRLLAGRVEEDENAVGPGDGPGYHVRVPLGPLAPDHRIATLTQAAYDTPMPSPLASTSYDAASFSVLPAPLKEHFVHPSTHVAMSALAAHSAPLLALHLATFADAFCIGLSLPHGLFDGTGIRLVLRALQAELAGEPWDPPPTNATNPVTTAVAKLLAAHPAPKVEAGAAAPGWAERWLGTNWIGWRMRFGKWWGVEERGVFVGDEVLAPLVVQAKAEVAAADDGKGGEGGGYVSTEDVLKMWFVRAAHASDWMSSSASLALSANMCFRHALGAATGTDLTNYPHNAFSWFSLTPALPLSALFSSPLSSLALAHRRSLLAARDPAHLAASLRVLQTSVSNLNFPANLHRPEWWHFASQGAGAFGHTVDWSAVVRGRAGGSKGRTGDAAGAGGEGEGRKEFGRLWMWLAAEGLDQVMCLNRVEGGWLVSGSLRKDRWASVERELRKLKEGKGGVPPAV